MKGSPGLGEQLPGGPQKPMRGFFRSACCLEGVAQTLEVWEEDTAAPLRVFLRGGSSAVPSCRVWGLERVARTLEVPERGELTPRGASPRSGSLAM